MFVQSILGSSKNGLGLVRGRYGLRMDACGFGEEKLKTGDHFESNNRSDVKMSAVSAWSGIIRLRMGAGGGLL
jgi:hypothetical protein